MIGSLLRLIRSAAIQAVIDGTERITRRSRAAWSAEPAHVPDERAGAASPRRMTGAYGGWE
jgi:hypothetical protein